MHGFAEKSCKLAKLLQKTDSLQKLANRFWADIWDLIKEKRRYKSNWLNTNLYWGAVRRYVRELDNITVKYGDTIVVFSFHFNSCFEMICNAPELDERGQGIVLCSVSEGTLNCVSHNKVLPLKGSLWSDLHHLKGSWGHKLLSLKVVFRGFFS